MLLQTLRALLPAAVVALLAGRAAATCTPAGTAAVPCQEVAANGLTFNCRVAGPPAGTPVLLLHGFPEFSRFWLPLLEHWAATQAPLRAVACDLRGYSPGASPTDPAAYAYPKLASDVWALADAFHFSTFHLIGHDHGAGLGWLVTAQAQQAQPQRVLTYTAMSVPHPDAFSAALVGPAADEEVQFASNYFNQFALPDSATRHESALWLCLGGPYGGFSNPEGLQRGLWWYTGSVPDYIALPPVLSDATVAKYRSQLVKCVRDAIPLPVTAGQARAEPLGLVSIPTLMVCGGRDPYVLCSRPSMDSAPYVRTGAYTNLTVDCGHDLLTCTGSVEGLAQVITVVTSHLMGHPPAGTTPDTPTDNASIAIDAHARVASAGAAGAPWTVGLAPLGAALAAALWLHLTPHLGEGEFRA